MNNKELKLEGNRFALYDNGQEIAEITWKTYDEYYDVNHTYTNPKYRGQGLAAILLDAIVEKAIKDEKLIQPSCPYVSDKFDMEPEKYAQLDARTRSRRVVEE